MGREQRRKEIKKNKRYTKDNNIEMNSEIHGSTVIKIILAVLGILLVLYYILAVFVTKELDVSNKNATDTTEQDDGSLDSSFSNKILAVATFRQSQEVYFVYYYDFDDVDDEIESVIENVTDYKVYKVDTGDSLNSNYVVLDSGNRDVTSIEDLKVINPTLIKIDNDKVVEYHEGADDILEFLDK